MYHKAASSAVWDQWHVEDGPRYPHSKVIQFCLRNFSKEKRANSLVLDLGCGNGINSLFMAKEGFSVVGVDFSPTAVQKANNLFKENGLSGNFSVKAIDQFLSEEAVFDLIISIGVFDCAGFETSERALANCAKMLSKIGRGIFVFASEPDFRVNINHELSLHGYSEQEVKALFTNKFNNINYDRYITTYENGSSHQNDWLITVSN